MVHPVAEGGCSVAPFEHVRELWHQLCDPELAPETKLQAVLARETDDLELPYGYLSSIDVDADRESFEVVQGEGFPVDVGDSVPLSESYCRKTIEAPDGTFAISDAVAEGRGDDPAYDNLGATYLGATVEVPDGLYGTLCFASQDPRAEPIDDQEIALVDMLAEWTGYELGVRAVGPADEPSIERRTPPVPMLSEEVDTLVDAIGERPRRLVLSLLREGSIETLADVLDHEGVEPTDAVALEHNHLPRLADAGYIEWDRETGAIARGPEFETVEGVLGCLEGAVDEVS